MGGSQGDVSAKPSATTTSKIAGKDIPSLAVHREVTEFPGGADKLTWSAQALFGSAPLFRRPDLGFFMPRMRRKTEPMMRMLKVQMLGVHIRARCRFKELWSFTWAERARARALTL
jgi:hypothetical protein